MRRFLIAFLSRLAIALILPIALASAASKNVDIIVTHDSGPPGSAAFITTETIQEIAHTNQGANWPLQRGMAFKYGAVNPATEHVEIRIASGSTCDGRLLDYQWDEISTRTENGMDGSWKHAVYTVRLPAVLANQYVTLAFCKVAGAYSPGSSAITLSDLCSAHPLAMDFNNVKNQDQSTRDSGSATWNLCDYIATTGREAPIQYANGQIRKGWVIRGEPVYATSGNKDPLMYVMAYVDVFSAPGSTGTIDRIKHVVRVSNAWMQVAAGSAGVAGATSCNGSTCPIGFTNDPQMVSYTPKLRDGATAVVDYDALFSLKVADPTLPTSTVTANTSTAGSGSRLHFTSGNVVGASYGAFVTDVTNASRLAAGCYVTDPNDPFLGSAGYGLSCSAASVQSGDTIRFDTYFTQLKAQNLPVNSDAIFGDDDSSYFQSPKSTGDHLYYTAACFNYSTTGTPPAGMTNNTQYYTAPMFGTLQGWAGDRFQLLTVPTVTSSGISSYLVNVTSRGSGAQTLQYCVNHRKFQSWYTADANGKSRWSGSIPSEPFENAFDQGSFTGERQYWEETGIVPPINLNDAAAWAVAALPEYEYPYATRQYWPGNVTLATGGTQGGQHSYVGIVAEWSARWWLNQDTTYVRRTRQFALDGESFPATTILSEATGRIPPINNGAPSGGNTGTGTPYAMLGPVYPDIAAPLAHGYFQRVTEPLYGVPITGTSPSQWWFGPWPGGIYNDHQGAYNYYPFVLFGDRHWLDAVQMQAQRSGTVMSDGVNGPSNELRPNRSFTFPAASGTPPAGKVFHGVIYPFNTYSQGPRAAAWMLRSLALGAGLGADGLPERALINDYIRENYYYWLAMKDHKDCHADLSPAPGAWSNSATGAVDNYQNQGFMDAYNAMANYVSFMLVNNPITRDQFPGAYTAAAAARFGDRGWPESTPGIYGGAFFYYIWKDMLQSGFGKCRADYVSTVEDYGAGEANVALDTSTGKMLQYRNCPIPANCGSFTMFNLTLGDKIKAVKTPSVGAGGYGDAGELSTGLVPALVDNGPAELPADQWYCVVNIDNSTGEFMIAPPLGTPPDECSSRGSAITSYSGLTADGDGRFSPVVYSHTPGAPTEIPSTMNPATTWQINGSFMWRLQSDVFTPNITYVWWAGNGICSIVSAGFSVAQPYCNQFLSMGIDIPTIRGTSGSNSGFDWNSTIVPPRAP